MFEEEREIHLHDNKRIRYFISYIKNIVRYRRKKVYIPILEIWGSNQCNLNCKECISRIPFVHSGNMVTDKVVESVGRLSQAANVGKVVISGGEPLLNRNLHKIIRCIDRMPDIKKIYIITNGTVMPDENLLSVLSVRRKPVKVIMNEYPEVESQILNIKMELEKRGIPYLIRRKGKYHWRKIGNNIREPLHFETGRMIYADCRLRNHAVLYEDIITKCSRGVLFGKELGICKLSMDYVKLTEAANTIFFRARLATCLDNSIHKEYCRKCFGVSEENPYLDEPGIQIGNNGNEDEEQWKEQG